MKFPSYEETQIEELEQAAHLLSMDIDKMMVDDVPEHIDAIMMRVNKLGICKADGEELVKLGAIRQDLIENLTEYRTTHNLAVVGNEVDKSGILGKLITAGIAALLAILGYIIYKLLGFILSLFGESSSLGGASAVAISNEKMKKVAEEVATDKSEASSIEKLLTVANENVLKFTIEAMFGKDIGEHFPYLTFPKVVYTNDNWTTELLLAMTEATKSIKDLPDAGDLDSEQLAEMIAYVKKTKNKDLVKMEALSKTYMEAFYKEESVPQEFADLNEQLQYFKTWTRSKMKWFRNKSTDALSLEVGDLSTIKKVTVEGRQEDAKSLEKILKAAVKDLENAKSDGGKGLKTYYSLTVNTPVNFMTNVVRKLINPYLTSQIKFVNKMDKALKNTDSRIESIIKFSAKQLKEEVNSDFINALPAKFVEALKATDIPDNLQPYKTKMKDKPKGLDELFSRVVAVDVG